MNYHSALIMQFKSLVDDPWVWAFIWSVIADVGTGFSKSLVATKTDKKTISTKGLSGLIKHIVVLFLVMGVYPFLKTVGFTAPANTIIVFYILIYVVSILENLGQMGIPIPEKIKKHLSKLQDDYEGDNK
ncbi:phage holin family protein [Latilactobacillus sakei]